MKTRLSFKEGSSADHVTLTRLIDDWSEKHLDPMLNSFGFSNAELQAVIDKYPKGAAKYRVKLHLHVPPKKVIVAKGNGNDLVTIVHGALERIRRELRKHIDRIRHQEVYKRKDRRRRLREQKAHLKELQPAVIEVIDRQAEPLRQRLERVIRRELAYLRAEGDLPPDYPTVQDILDEVMLTVKADWNESAADAALYPRMLKAMHDILDREVSASRVYGKAVSLEAAPPQDAEDQAEAMVGEELTEFWQPDEALHIEDVLADREAENPEQVLEEAEEATDGLSYLLEVMRSLPIDWRRAMLLHDVDGVSVEDLALCFGRSADTIQGWIDSAGVFLDARLSDAGFTTGSGELLAGLRETWPPGTGTPQV